MNTVGAQLKNVGLCIRYVNFARDPHQRPSLEGYAGLVVLGGPMNADNTANYPNLATEVELIKEALDRNMQDLSHDVFGKWMEQFALRRRAILGSRQELKNTSKKAP